jgi:hypothetical protein
VSQLSSIYVELGIGLVLAFLLLSLLVSGLNEALNRLFSIRSKFLWAYLRDLLEGGVKPTDADTHSSRLPASVADVLLRAPLNRMPGGDPRPVHAAPPPPMTATKVGADGLYERLQEIDRAKEGRTSISQIPAQQFAAAVIELALASGKSVDELLAELKDTRSPLYATFHGLWVTAEGEVERFRAGVERWFDGEMQRLSRLYRRSARWVITVLAGLVALLVGLDALAYGQYLLSDQAYRTQVVAVAGGNPDKLVNLQETCQRLADRQGEQPPQPDPYRCIAGVLANPALAQVLGGSLVRVDLATTGGPRFSWNGGAWLANVRSPGHWPGLLLTVVALMFGAPFWWDILRRLTGVRSSASISSRRG